MTDYLNKPVQGHELAKASEPCDMSGGGLLPQQVAGRAPAGDVLDLALLDSFRELQQDGGPDLVEELVDLYLTDTKVLLVELRTAVRSQDLRAARRIVHSLKGSSDNLGVHGMAALCSKLETQFSRAIEEAETTLSQLDEELERVQQALADGLQPA